MVIFDLDGVLVNTSGLHETAFIESCLDHKPDMPLTREFHRHELEGLSTAQKLSRLTDLGWLTAADASHVALDKQQRTRTALKEKVTPNKNLFALLDSLRSDGLDLAVATNSIRDTLKLCLQGLEVEDYFRISVCNEDVLNKKPHPECYWRCMISRGCVPEEVVIIEDSPLGRSGAYSTGARVVPVLGPHEVTLPNLYSSIVKDSQKSKSAAPWENTSLTVVVPMAGSGSRFAEAGFVFPKPLVEVHGRPMIQVVMENLNIRAKFLFIVQKVHEHRFNIDAMLKLLYPGCEIVTVEELTAGAACTVLLAERFIDSDNPLLIVNSDQFIKWSALETMSRLETENLDGAVLTFASSHPKWSYVALNDETGLVTEVAEKRPISNHATVGIYYWRRGRDFVRYAKKMIARNERVNGEFYIAPVYNHAIADGARIKSWDVDQMWGLGTPEDLEYFLEHGPLSPRT
jgi:HAD superfamily hydrolase (TIGR01509 family)